MIKELQASKKAHTWELVALLPGKIAVRCKCVYKNQDQISWLNGTEQSQTRCQGLQPGIWHRLRRDFCSSCLSYFCSQPSCHCSGREMGMIHLVSQFMSAPRSAQYVVVLPILWV